MEIKETFTGAEKEFYMKEALKEAKKAEDLGEVPIGCVIVFEKEIIARGFNLRETKQLATSHAEMNAIQQACERQKSFRLENCQLFVTLEPCAMCSGAMVLGRVPEVYFGAYDKKGGTAGTLMNLLEEKRFNHQAYVEGGILEKECGEILTIFFSAIRKRKKAEKKAGNLLKNTLK